MYENTLSFIHKKNASSNYTVISFIKFQKFDDRLLDWVLPEAELRQIF